MPKKSYLPKKWADAARKASNPGHGYEWDSVERVKERLEQRYLAPPVHTED